MLIKDEFRIKEGTVIKWQLNLPEDTECDGVINNTYRVREVKLLCIKNYPHHSDFKLLEHPYRIENIQNAVLYMRGFYKPDHSVIPFARY